MPSRHYSYFSAASPRRRLGIFATCLWICSVSAVAAPAGAQAQSAGAEAESDPVLASWGEQPSVTNCVDCHYAGGRRGFAAATPRDTTFARLDELKRWLSEDKHAIARRRIEPLTADELQDEMQSMLEKLERDRIELDSVPADWFGLSNILSRRICDKLGYDVATAAGYELFRDNCLTCHGGYRDERDILAFARRAGDQTDISPQPGISCNYCHQIGDNDAWVQAHGVARAGESWRLLSPEEKADAGMRDLVNAATAAANCNDCHIGNREKNMFVTHVMYAAGHPMLPGIELQTFIQSMPPHWRSERERYQALEPFAGRQQYYQTNFPKLFEGDRIQRVGPGDMFWQSRNVLIGAMSAKLHWLDLLIASAPDDRWGDYALYDCAACHHELREPSPRQQRGVHPLHDYVAAPGRPRSAEWPDALLPVALDMAGSQHRRDVDQLDAKLAAAMNQTPFGDPVVIAQIARELRAELTEAIRSAEAKSITAPGARALIKRFAQTPASRLLVYDAARQLVWAIQAIAAELETMGQPLPGDLMQEIAALSGDAADGQSTGIEATLPAGRSVFIFPENLFAELERRAQFDPTVLSQRLEKIASAIVIQPTPAR